MNVRRREGGSRSFKILPAIVKQISCHLRSEGRVPASQLRDTGREGTEKKGQTREK